MNARTPRITVLAGGVGGSRFLVGMRETVRRRGIDRAQDHLVAIVNTGDDLWLSGIRLQPDIDSILYALAGVNDAERGWGRREETERVARELRSWGAGWPWFTLGDLDLGTHIARTGWLRDGLTPTQVVELLGRRWDLGVRMLPMTDTEVDTLVTVRDGDDVRQLHFQEWWTRHRAALTPLRFDNPGIDSALPAPGVTEAILDADVVVLAPSNPVVSIGPILAVPGMRTALQSTKARVVGVSPIIDGAVVRGMADICLEALGVATSADTVAALYGARERGGLLDAWLVAEEDRALVPAIREIGIRALVAPLWMHGGTASADVAEAALGASGFE
ncbi:2-phospho-L-lactate transferase [Microbacterium saperdae]|uniref:LPPG:FO 2-phospho-L-lactate transferase n=1 Tax=Microbacterium saperdae TaxID=69368 RepID=A0A543BL86_9MICO|nr:2-phospho-L-lactate transferase [Microbacterium saperdae]TQL85592.1 LPPG:FO 2-phospho-L-lactate transferase [Microbacterium saperdae]GGM62411.1 2-phospho-L-lactate transferase [Microbacterium saperdae]